MQIILSHDPEPEDPTLIWNANPWGGCQWIEDPTWNHRDAHVGAFRNRFSLKKRTKIRFHLTADQRYTAFLDGVRIGFGPERGTDSGWFYQTHERTLPAGRHTLVVCVWWLPREKQSAHIGHIGHRPSLLVKGEGDMHHALTTGQAAWQVMPVGGVTFLPSSLPQGYCCIGDRTQIAAADWPRGVTQGRGPSSAWRPAQAGPYAMIARHVKSGFADERLLAHGTLPPMYEKTIRAGKIRHAQRHPTIDEARQSVFQEQQHDATLAAEFQHMLAGRAPVQIPPRTTLRVLVDVDQYVCGWPMLTTSKGDGATITIGWAEALFTRPDGNEKGHRDIIEGKYFCGFEDRLICDGSTAFSFEPFWWEAGRYIRLLIETADKPLRVDAFAIRETHYPHVFQSAFVCDDPRWGPLQRIAQRGLEMCSHETYFDCPYYEQLMYAGDTRLEILTTYATTSDDRLPRKAITLFDRSRDASGLTRSRTPCSESQIIPPFSLWWIMMVHDFAFWRNDLDFVRARMPGVRAVLEAFRSHVDADGLLYALQGWNFTDWVVTWERGGTPPDGQDGANATLNLQFAWVLRAVAELEDRFGEPELAARNRRTADGITRAAQHHFWVPERNLFAENKSKTRFSEHAQCMAVLGDSLPENAQIADPLLHAEDLDRTTIYFAHYLFETFQKLRLPNAIYNRLQLWFEHEKLGLKTTVEMPEPTRSDCHAWGAHPVFHAYATFAGIRPSAPGFSAVTITPQPGPLRSLKASMIHPSGGIIEVHIEQADDGTLHGHARVPDGLPATLILNPGAKPQTWVGGVHHF